MLKFVLFSSFLLNCFADFSELETTEAPNPRRQLKCCPKREEPGYGDNPMCEEPRHECCGLTGEWVCSVGDGKNFPCVYEDLDFSQGPFGRVCRRGDGDGTDDDGTDDDGTDDDDDTDDDSYEDSDDKRFFCCDPEDEPGYGDNPICFEGHRCCKLTGEWTCSTGDAKTFPCFLGKLDYSQGPFGRACGGRGDRGSDDRTSMKNTREPRDEETSKDRRYREDSFDHDDENSCIRRFGRCYTSCSRAAKVRNRGKLRSQKRCQRGVKSCVSRCTAGLNECIDLHSKCDDDDDNDRDDSMNTREPRDDRRDRRDDETTTRRPRDRNNDRRG